MAYEHFLKGQFFRRQQTPAALDRAIAYFETAIARDSGYARAHAGLADALALRVLFGDRPPRVEHPRALRAAARAVALDTALADAHASLGHLAFIYQWDWATADRELQRALALDSTLTTARLWRGIALLDRRRFAEAAAVLERALAADPLAATVRMTLGRVHLARGEPARAVVLLQSALELNPRFAYAHQQLGHAYLRDGRGAAARAAFARAAAVGGASDSAQLAYAYGATGHRMEALTLLSALLLSAERRYLPPFGVAMAYAGLGDADAAFRWLERAVEERAAFMDGLAVAPGFASLHGDPRWSQLLRRVLPPK
jgi:tetratricopeptide (TPR) repeat protein